jgi:hypothetical protein
MRCTGSSLLDNKATGTGTSTTEAGYGALYY